MCGLFGWIATGDPKRTDYRLLPGLTRHLGILSAQRGSDSIGMAYMRSDLSAPAFVRAVGHPRQMIPTLSEALAPAFEPGALWLMGHTRSATVGKVDLDNTHPFLMGKTIGAHNGSIQNFWVLPIPKDTYTLPGCDSAALIALIDAIGAKEALAAAYGTVNMTISQPPYQAVTLYKEYETGLAVYYLRSKGLILWASDDDFLKDVLLVLGLSTSKGSPNHFLIMEKERLSPIGPSSIGKERVYWDGPTIPAPTKTYTYEDSGYWHAPAAQGACRTGYGTAATRTRPKGPAHRSVFSETLWHKGPDTETCEYCKGYQKRSAPWVIYRRKARGLSVLKDGEAWGAPTRCLNCRQGIDLTWFREGYLCGRCDAWMARRPDFGPLPSCPQELLTQGGSAGSRPVISYPVAGPVTNGAAHA